MTGTATAITVFHRAQDEQDVRRWHDGYMALAARAPGFVSHRETACDSTRFDPALAVTFDSQAQLHAWLDSAERTRAMADGRCSGIFTACPDIVVGETLSPPTGIVVFDHSVADGQAAAFLHNQESLVALGAGFAGFEGACLLGPAGGAGNDWISVLRYRTDQQLQSWMNSEQRREALPALRSGLSAEFSVVTHSTPFGSILRVQDGATRVTPDWKTAMLVLLVLYPTVMTLSRFLGPVLSEVGAEPWLAMWLSQIVSVAAMTWFLMPLVTRWFRRWLDPVDGAGVRVSTIGAVIVALGYVAFLTLFATVSWLDFWDVPN
jgi:hypothetical protein